MQSVVQTPLSVTMQDVFLLIWSVTVLMTVEIIVMKTTVLVHVRRDILLLVK